MGGRGRRQALVLRGAATAAPTKSGQRRCSSAVPQHKLRRQGIGYGGKGKLGARQQLRSGSSPQSAGTAPQALWEQT